MNVHGRWAEMCDSVGYAAVLVPLGMAVSVRGRERKKKKTKTPPSSNIARKQCAELSAARSYHDSH